MKKMYLITFAMLIACGFTATAVHARKKPVVKRETIALQETSGKSKEFSTDPSATREVITLDSHTSENQWTVESDSTAKREIIHIDGDRSNGNGKYIFSSIRDGVNHGLDYVGKAEYQTNWERNRKVRFFDSSSHWSGFGLGYSGLVTSLGNLNIPQDAQFMSQRANSINVNLNFISTGIVSTRHFALVSGLGMELNNFRFDRNVTLTTNSSGYIIADESFNERGINLRKSKLSTNYLTIPLLAEYRTKGGRGRQFYVYGGVTGGWCFNAHTKIKYRSDGGTHKQKQRSGLNIRNFKYGYTVGAGYGRIGLYASYFPQSIFRSGKGPEVRQANIGLHLNFGGRRN